MFDTIFIRYAVHGASIVEWNLGGLRVHREWGDRGTTSTLRQDGEHLDNSDVYILDMGPELAGGVLRQRRVGSIMILAG